MSFLIITAPFYPVFVMVTAEEPPKEVLPVTEAKAILVNSDQKPVGHLILKEVPTGLLLRFSARGLLPGWHGVHFHSVGDCSDPSFEKAGGHFNPEKKQHGLKNPKGPHAGDMPNLYVSESGVLEAEFLDTRVSLKGKGGMPALLDNNGSAVIIHEHEDDNFTQPVGGSGKRMFCGVLKLQKSPAKK